MAEDWIHEYARDVVGIPLLEVLRIIKRSKCLLRVLHARDEGSISNRRTTLQHDTSHLASKPVVYVVDI